MDLKNILKVKLRLDKLGVHYETGGKAAASVVVSLKLVYIEQCCVEFTDATRPTDDLRKDAKAGQFLVFVYNDQHKHSAYVFISKNQQANEIKRTVRQLYDLYVLVSRSPVTQTLASAHTCRTRRASKSGSC